MSFDATETKQQISNAMGAMLLLHSSNQALIEVAIEPSSSSWYPILDQELGAVENLVVQWRQNGFLYFQNEILSQVVTCGQDFVGSQAEIDSLFEKLQSNFSESLKQEIAQKMAALETPVSSMVSQMQAYQAQLADYEKQLEVPHHNMLNTVGQIQAQAARIQTEIATINTKIAALQKQVTADRAAIAKAKAEESRGTAETIFGIVFAPFTGGLSLILAGIGVASITEAKQKVSELESTISGYQSQIAGDQSSLSKDEKQISTLNGLTMSTQIALNDIDGINAAMDALRTTWGVLQGQLQKTVQDVQNADNAQEAILGKVWFDAACVTWSNILQFAQNMASQNAPIPDRVQIGN